VKAQLSRIGIFKGKVMSGNQKKEPKPGVKPENPFPYGAELVLRNSEHYRSMAKNSLFAALGLLGLSIFLAFTVYALATRPVPVLSYMMDDKGHVVPLQPIRNPTVTDTQVLNWSRDRVVDLHTFTFTNWRGELQGLSKYFVKSAYENYIAALTNSKVIKKITNDKLLVTATPSRAPVITKKGVVNGVYMWTVEMPIIQTIEGGNTAPVNNNLVAQMVVQRVPRTETLDGIKVRSYLVREGGLR